MTLSITFAIRELRSGVRGFRIFLACLALGVAALAAAGSTAEAFRQGLAAQSRNILGGDLAVSVEGRPFTAAEASAFHHLGRCSDRLHVRAMASPHAGSDDRRLVEVSGVDGAYPLAGTVELRGADRLGQAMAPIAGIPGVAVAPELLTRLHIRLGDTMMIGDVTFKVRGVIVKEPDTLSRSLPLGPRVIVSREALLSTGLIQADSLFGEAVTIALPAGADANRVEAALNAAFPGAGLSIRGRSEALSGLGRLIDQLDFFLGFIGLASLLTGGLGVSSAVSAYLGARRPSIAVLKALGADGALIRNIYLIQLGTLTAAGILLGLIVGAVTPFLLGAIAGDRLPIPVLFALYPWPLVKAALFGALAAAVFSLGPLALARSTPPAALFRRDLTGSVSFGWEWVAIVLGAAGLVGLATLTAPNPIVAGGMVVGLAVGFLILWGLGGLITLLAARLRRLFAGAFRIGLANLSGPRSAARTASPSMGFGIALLTAIILIQSSLLAQVTTAAGKTAPSLVFTQIPPEETKTFDGIVATSLGPLKPDRYRRYPFATGRLTRINGRDVASVKIAPKVKWAFDQDVTLSALDTAPPDAKLAEGKWWPSGYPGPPEVVLDEEIAAGAGIKLGDSVTVSVLGRDLDARVAGTRKIDFGQFGANFPIILNAGALAGANLRHIALMRTTRTQEDAITVAIGRAFPAINIISIREQLDAAAEIFAQMGWAIRAAAGVALAASLLVLAGAIAGNAQARAREAAVLKVLGSTRGFIIATYCIEYGAVAVVAGATGTGLGTTAALLIVRLGMKAPFVADWLTVMVAMLGVVIMGVIFGAIAALTTLARHPMSALRLD